MSYKAALSELNKNLELYLKNQCDPAINHLSKAMYQLTVAIEQDFKAQSATLKKIRDATERIPARKK
jgi:hypothetical protein